jgi:PAS domain S-box-containing protein
VLVLVSLLSLVVAAVVVERRTARLWREISEVIEPAQARLGQVQLDLALQIAGIRGFLLTGHSLFAASYWNARANGLAEEARLASLAGQLDGQLAADVTALSGKLRLADGFADSLFAGQLSREGAVARLDARQGLLQDVVGTSTRLNSTLTGVLLARRRQVRDTERAALWMTLALVGLALIAAAMVAHLGRAYRELALRFESRAQREAELAAALRESEGRFRQITENIREFIWLSDPEFTKHFYVNAAYERIWGRSRDEALDNPRSLLLGVHPDDRDRVALALDGLQKGTYDIEFRVVRPDGTERWVWSRGFPVRDENGAIYRVAGISEDITEWKTAELERERVTESRARLIRGFTHDVKNPLGAADGFLSLLEDGVLGELSPKQLASVAKTRRSIRSALDLIAHLLELSRAEAGLLEIRQSPVDLREILDDMGEQFRGQAEHAGLDFRLELPADLPSTLSDGERVRQVLANLLSNAIKYTPAGGCVAVRACVASGDAAPAPGTWIAMQVVDTGPGIRADQQHMLFEEFARFDSSGVAGAGIGLAISQKIAKALDGRITVVSEEGRGSTFTLWLPVRSPQK